MLDHSRDALLAPGGRPLNLLDVAQCVGAKIVLIHADEPLRSRAEDQRGLVTPAMRVAVAIRLVMSQPATLFQDFDDREDGLFHLEPGKQWRVRQEATVVSNKKNHQQTKKTAHEEDNETETGRRMHGTGAGIQSYVLADDDGDLPILERMLQLQAFQYRAVEKRDYRF